MNDDQAHDKEHHFSDNAEHDYIVNTDQQRVMQVLLCLQSNALKFTKGGEVHIIVEIKDGFLQIAVQDTGIGISKED